MNNLIVNSCLAILNFKRSDFEEQSKIAVFNKALLDKIKEMLDKHGSNELEIMLRYKHSGEVELIPTSKVYTRGIGGDLEPIEEKRHRFVEPTVMSPEDFIKSLKTESGSLEQVVKEEPESTEKYNEALKYIIKVLKAAKDQGKTVTQEARKRFIDAVLEKRGIAATKFWDWYKEKQQQAKKLKTIADILGTTLTKTADFLTELNPDEEKPAFDEKTNKEVTVDKDTTTEGRPVVTISDKDNTEKKTYDQNSPELKNITDDLSQIIAFTAEQRTVLAELGYTV